MLHTNFQKTTENFIEPACAQSQPRAIAVIAGADGQPPLPAHVLELVSDRLEAPVQLYFSSARQLRAYKTSDSDAAEIALVICDRPITGPLATLPALYASEITDGIPLRTLMRQIDAITENAVRPRAA
ncbi:MAG: hypothetical protein MRY81_24915 [Donghicola eburneus]|nr:hypothetical protein [Donghicola eburneus]MCI5042894.1 hypothetical protein [Donghicola eburneus]